MLFEKRNKRFHSCQHFFQELLRAGTRDFNLGGGGGGAQIGNRDTLQQTIFQERSAFLTKHSETAIKGCAGN